jgi:HlyD family secretion protein
VGSSYVFLGAFLAIALVYTFYVNLFFVPSEQALLYTPTVDLIAPEDGTVAAVYVSEGERIAEGDPLLQVKSPQLERLLSEARIQVREAEIAQQRLTDLIATESGAIDTYRLIASDQVVATSARLSAAQKQLSLLEHQHARVFQLFQQGMVSSQEMDRIEADQYRARQAVAEVQADLRIARAAREAAQTGKYYSSNRFEGRLPELKDELAAAKSQVELAKTRLMELERQSDQLTLRAPGSGHVRQIPVVAGNAIKGGMLAISLLTDQTPKVYARVPSDQLAQIALGDDARVFVPALSREFTARVVAVEPRLWSLPENLRRLLGEPGEGGLAVLALAPGELDTSSLQPGLPVSVELRNETGRQAMHQLASLLNLIEPNAAAEPLPASAARYSGVDTNVNAR